MTADEQPEDIAAAWAQDFAHQRATIDAWLAEWRSGLTDEEVRDGVTEYDRLRKRNQRRKRKGLPAEDVPEEISLMMAEYQHRRKYGLMGNLAPDELEARRLKHRLARTPEAEWLQSLSDDELRLAVRDKGRLTRLGQEIPAEVRLKVMEFARRYASGRLRVLPPEERLERRISAWRYVPDAEAASWSDDECRAGAAEYEFYRKRDVQPPEDAVRKIRELRHRHHTGGISLLGPDERAERCRAGQRISAERSRKEQAERVKILPPPTELRKRREALGLTASELGKRLGVSQALITMWERGTVIPSSRLTGPLLAALESADLGNPKPRSWEQRRAQRASSMPPLEALREGRLALGLTRAELAAKLSISAASIEQWENGRAIPGPTNYGPYLEALGLTGKAGQMKLSDLRTAAEIHEQDMRDDPEYRREYERTKGASDLEIAALRDQAGLPPEIGAQIGEARRHPERRAAYRRRTAPQ